MSKSKLRCKVGDLVFIIKASERNIGKIARVIEPWVDDGSGIRGDWIIRTEGEPFYINFGSGRGINGVAPDGHLLPIRGDDAPPTRVRTRRKPVAN